MLGLGGRDRDLETRTERCLDQIFGHSHTTMEREEQYDLRGLYLGGGGYVDTHLRFCIWTKTPGEGWTLTRICGEVEQVVKEEEIHGLKLEIIGGVLRKSPLRDVHECAARKKNGLYSVHGAEGYSTS